MAASSPISTSISVSGTMSEYSYHQPCSSTRQRNAPSFCACSTPMSSRSRCSEADPDTSGLHPRQVRNGDAAVGSGRRSEAAEAGPVSTCSRPRSLSEPTKVPRDAPRRALLNLVHPQRPDSPSGIYSTPRSLQIPRHKQRPMTIRLPAASRAGARATRPAG